MLKVTLNVDGLLSIPQRSTAMQKRLGSQIEKLRNNVKEKDRELALKDQSLEEAKRQKDAISQKMMQLRQTIKQNQTKTISLVKKKAEAEEQLQLKERELQLLRTIVQKDSELLQKDRELLQNKEKEIRELRQHLQSVESELTLERNLSKELRKKLQQATEELGKKSAVEREREEAKEYLKTHLERERQTVDSLRVQLTSKDQHIREVQVHILLDTLKSKLCTMIVLHCSSSIRFPLQGPSVRAIQRKLVNMSS